MVIGNDADNTNTLTTMTTKFKPFRAKSRTISVNLAGRPAKLTHETRHGLLGPNYRSSSWWIKYDGSICQMGPYTKAQIREFAA